MLPVAYLSLPQHLGTHEARTPSAPISIPPTLPLTGGTQRCTLQEESSTSAGFHPSKPTSPLGFPLELQGSPPGTQGQGPAALGTSAWSPPGAGSSKPTPQLPKEPFNPPCTGFLGKPFSPHLPSVALQVTAALAATQDAF